MFEVVGLLVPDGNVLLVVRRSEYVKCACVSVCASVMLLIELVQWEKEIECGRAGSRVFVVRSTAFRCPFINIQAIQIHTLTQAIY